MKSFLNLIRWKNLLFIAITQLLIKFVFFENMGADTVLNNIEYGLLIFVNIALAAAGYIINDLNDVKADNINKPHKSYIDQGISEKLAFIWFLIFNISAVVIGFYLANIIGYPTFSALFIMCSALLYIYSTYLKFVPLAGNISVSLMVGGVAILPGIFDLLPGITPLNQEKQAFLFFTLLDYAIFAFLINLLREMVKDQEDINGDYNVGISTLPILLGHSRTNKIIFVIGILPVAALVYYIYNYIFDDTFLVLYTLILILGPLLYFEIRILEAKKKKEYTHLSLILKIILFFGLISIGFHQFLLT
ncbi:geranylgeranylglycerol-phosphate geranylgeranyltransferase [Salegentibacter sp. JZCK2]|uniref:geranylgeranylglycerol-phosphate geranylgeranyltransferase n=1 Tax=Salegentibacter tibetensis TaxID=2873600 RepID=UPI001CCFB8FD|nr:geranylgeranylglycerol-phosphate geranylgeranyltransferase [Salegentibacter tibetensis]MBZ9729182.1 geranylgeranylglycerol-phosphate geranylgeranyltransferase [Salegentibacter tibetensis]